MSGVCVYHAALARALRWAAFALVGASIGCAVAHHAFDVDATLLTYMNVVSGVALVAGALGALSGVIARE